jgi:hypothetical protein
MSNPVITRLGINQFWYKHWYSDSSYSLNLQQDNLFQELVQLYLDYGLVLKSNIFIHEYWYKFNDVKKLRLSYEFRTYNTFFRRFYYSNNIVGIEHTFLLRNKTPEYFPMRTWFFKYANWVVISVNWFKPLKQRKLKELHPNSASAANVISKHSANYYQLKRLKLVLYLTTKKYFNNKKYMF